MELANDIAVASFLAWAAGTVVRAYVTFNFETHFNGVQFKGRYLIPSRKYAFSEISHAGVRRIMLALKIITLLSGLVFILAAVAIQILKVI